MAIIFLNPNEKYSLNYFIVHLWYFKLLFFFFHLLPFFGEKSYFIKTIYIYSFIPFCAHRNHYFNLLFFEVWNSRSGFLFVFPPELSLWFLRVLLEAFWVISKLLPGIARADNSSILIGSPLLTKAPWMLETDGTSVSFLFLAASSFFIPRGQLKIWKSLFAFFFPILGQSSSCERELDNTLPRVCAAT